MMSMPVFIFIYVTLMSYGFYPSPIHAVYGLSHKDETTINLPLAERNKRETNCWWTGCQTNDRAVVGCGQYPRVEKSRRKCENGLEFECCKGALSRKPTVTSQAMQNTPSVTRDPSELPQQAKPKPTTSGVTKKPGELIQGAKPKLATDEKTTGSGCWWTGCQPNDWAVVGCAQYKRAEKTRKKCENGFEYECCEGSNNASGTVNSQASPNISPVTKKPAKLPQSTKPTPTTTEKTSGICWWTGCQAKDWAVVGCAQYERVEKARRKCKSGYEYQCCEGKLLPESIRPTGGGEDCLWSDCSKANSSQMTCPDSFRKDRHSSCANGGVMIECCGKLPPEEEDDDIDSLTGDSYTDFTKNLFLRDYDFAVETDNLKCEAVDVGKKHMIQINKKEAIRLCDLCPNLPQKHLLDVFLDRVPTRAESNVDFSDCVGHCYLDKTCVALSYDRDDSICYLFDSTAGKYEEEEGWNTVLMTQPSSTIQEWTVTRNTRFLGYYTNSSREATFLNCLDKCDRAPECNYAGYSFETKNCSMYETDDDIEYVDLVYGHAVAVRNLVTLKKPSDRFQQEGDDLKAPDITETNSGKCSKFKNNTHGANFNQACLTGGSDFFGCDRQTGCKLCYFPEKTEENGKLPICEESEFARVESVKAAIKNSMDICVNMKTCVGVGYNSKSGLVSTMTFKEYLSDMYNTKFMIKHPEDTDRQYLALYDIVPNAEFKILTAAGAEWEEESGKTFQQCLALFHKKKQFTRVSYHVTNRKCKLTTESSGFVRKQSLTSLSLFRKPALLSSALTYMRTPGYAINGNPKLTKRDCKKNCEEICTKQCNMQHWCRYISINVKPNGAICHFYDDNQDFRFQADENTTIMSRVAITNFTLESFTTWSNFRSYDLFNCFNEPNKQTQTQLATFNKTQEDDIEEDQDEEVESNGRARRSGFGDWISGLAKDAWNGIKQVGQGLYDTGKEVGNTVVNLAKLDVDEAFKSFKKIPVVDLGIKTGELTGAVFTGDWDKAKEKGMEVLESDGFALVTSVAIPGGGGAIAQGTKQVLKSGLSNALKKGGKKVIKEGLEHIDDIAKKGSRSIKGKPKPPKKTKQGNKKKNKDKKKKDEIDSERGEACERKDRQRRATFKKKKNPRMCRDKRRRRQKLCNDPGSCEEKTLQKECLMDKREADRIANTIPETLKDCRRKKRGKYCEYECTAGYTEEKLPVGCVKAQRGRLRWWRYPKCTLDKCPGGAAPLLVMKAPQRSSIAGRRRILNGPITVYVVSFNKPRKLPFWSIALHQSSQFRSSNYNAIKNYDRLSYFTLHPCRELQGHQIGTGFYNKSGWDRGHLTPASIARWSEKAIRVLGLYTNVAPQDPYTNRTPWQRIEAHIECFSKSFRSLVATGICQESIGSIPSGVPGVPNADVPACFWKLICYQDEKRNYRVVGFYGNNRLTTTTAEKRARRADVFRPRSQNELLGLITGFIGFQGVWLSGGPIAALGRPISMSGGAWYPLNPYECAKSVDLIDEEREGWRMALNRKRRHPLKRGENAQNINLDPQSERRKRRQADNEGGIKRGCHGSQLDNQLDLESFFNRQRGENEVGSVSTVEGLEDGEDERDEGDGSVKVTVQKCGKRIVGYYTSWGKKTIAGLELQRLTHVIYGFLEMKEDGTIVIGTPDRKNTIDADADTKKAKERLEDLMESAKRYPHLKVMFAVGGWENSQYFSNVAASPDKRLVFIASIIKMIDRFGFDGVDIDWEYPVTGGAKEGVPADKQNYVQLMKELRTALDNLASEAEREDKYLISFAGAAGQWTLDPGFDLPGLFKYVDFVNIMTYDYFGAWASKWGAYTGPPAPLYFGMPTGFSGKTNVDWSVKYYTCKTKAPHKINMGVPFYGRFWKNVGDPVDKEDEMWRKATTVNGVFEGGYVPFNEVKTKYLTNGAFQKRYHKEAQTPYAWNPKEKTFLGYEDEKSMNAKVKYAVDKNVGGLMIWALELDDDDLTLLDIVSSAPLCQNTSPTHVNHKCSPIDEKRWWTPEDGDDKAGLCSRSAPLYKGYYPVCDPDDPGYACCSAAGYCGKGPKFCDCPTCKNYRKDPKLILEEPIKPSIPVTWYLLNDPDGKRGRCGRKIPKIGGVYPTCNPDDANTHCCSNGGYCGNSDKHCKCDGCIDFKKNPKYKFGPKKWWTLEDGEKLGGQCGPKAPKVDGIYEAECEGTSKFHCCSPDGWCGSGPNFCDCKGCKNFKT